MIVDTVVYAKLFAFLYLSVAVGLLFNRDYYYKAFKSYMADGALMMLGGYFALILGFVITQTHDVWGWNAAGLVTLFGWLGLIKGIMLLAFPKSYDWVSNMFKNKVPSWMVWFVLILGLVFTYIGWWA
jgi:hypothetical protein